MRNYKLISFLCLTIGWIALIVVHIAQSVLRYGNAQNGDIGVIMFWSAFFLLIYWSLFLLIPEKRVTKILNKYGLISFTLLLGLYALLGFTILIGWAFLLYLEFLEVFNDAFVFGLVYGFSFYFFARKYGDHVMRPIKVMILLLPLIFLSLYLYLAPLLVPSYIFKYAPQFVREDILEKTIPKFKVGDNYEDLEKSLPGYFRVDDCKGSMGAQLEKFQFGIDINCCKIVSINHGPRTNEGFTIGGDILRKPCN
jgi:hypothetical protein